MVAERLARHYTPVTTANELRNFVEAVLAAVPVHAIQSLSDSMPSGITPVTVAGGSRSRY